MKHLKGLRFSGTLMSIALLSACGSGSSDTSVAELTPTAPTQPISSNDTTAPVIELLGESPYTLALGQAFEEPGAKAMDNVDGEVPVTVNRPSLSDIGTYSIIYSAKDSAGNESSTARTVFVKDVVAPVITLIGSSNLTISYGEPYNEQGATAIDDTDGNVDVNINGSVGEELGNYILTYSAIDTSGNESSIQRAVIVEDVVAPVITLIGSDRLKMSFGEYYNEQGATAIDDTDGSVDVTIFGTIGDELGNYTLTYSAIDTSGNESSIQRAVIVEDVLAPVITLIGSDRVTMSFGEYYNEQGATAIDDTDGSVDVTIIGSIGEELGTYILAYSAADTSGNASSIQRAVTVDDLIGPVIALNGQENINLEFGNSYNEQGATAIDDVDGNVEVSIDGTVEEDVGTYIVSYSATDNAGNESIVERRVKVEKWLFEDDIKRDIVQSTPTAINVPKGLAARLDIEYLGAFRVVAQGESNSGGAVGTLGFNYDNNSLYLAGWSREHAIAEFRIPNEFSFENDAIDIPSASVLQDYVIIRERKQEGKANNRINGMLYYEQNLLVTSEIWYDATGANKDNLQVFSDSMALATGNYKGMLQLEGEAKAAGYMSIIPEMWQEAFGGEYLAGWASNYSITSRYSQGPSLYVFDPEEAVFTADMNNKKVKSTSKMVFPLGNGTTLVKDGSVNKRDISPIWGPSSRANYGFIVPNSDIFMVVGKHSGIHSGIGYKIIQDNGHECGGPCTYEADDNYNYFWLFDVNEILDAQSPHEIQPISYGKWSHPYDKSGKYRVIGAVFDHVQKRLFVTIELAGSLSLYDYAPLVISYGLKAKE
jgi:hypothetical protein